MRKRSKYRPKGVLLDTMHWVRMGMQPLVTAAPGENTRLRIKNYAAMDMLRKGKGGKEHVDVVITALNVAEALMRLHIGDELFKDVRAGQDALFAMAKRGAQIGRFVFTGAELQAVAHAMAIHDAQLDISTIADLENALHIIREELRHKRMRVIDDCLEPV